MTLGDLFNSKSMETEAKPFYQSAVAALERAGKLGSKDEKLVNELKRLQAVAKGGMGQYDDSLKDFIALLKASPNAWQIQMDAARTLQNWGNTTKTSAPLAKALGGTEKFQDPLDQAAKKPHLGMVKIGRRFQIKTEVQRFVLPIAFGRGGDSISIWCDRKEFKGDVGGTQTIEDRQNKRFPVGRARLEASIRQIGKNRYGNNWARNSELNASFD